MSPPGQALRGKPRGFPVLLALLSSLYFWQSTRISEPPRQLMAGPRLFPEIIGILLICMALIIVWEETVRGAVSPGSTERRHIRDWPAVWVVLAATLAYIGVFEALGFVLSTVLLLFGLSAFFEPQRRLRNLAAAGGFSLFFWYLFTRLLAVSLPRGFLGHLLG